MAATVTGAGPVGRPWRMVGTSMAPNLLLMCKLLFLLLALHGFQAKLSDPFIPFVGALDAVRSPSEAFGWGLRISFFAGGACLLCNIRTRAAAIVLGITVLLALAASKPLYRNHILIVGCLFLLSGLHARDEEPWMLALQMAIVYFGAALNKSLEADWWSGRFMHHWMTDRLDHPIYGWLAPLFPGMSFAAVVSWLVIASEWLLALLFLVRRWHPLAVAISLAMHGSFFLIVGRTPFGHFLEDILLAMLAFLHWPRGVIEVSAARRLHRPLAWLTRLANWDGQFVAGDPLPDGGPAWWRVRHDGRTRTNAAGVLECLRYNAAFYVVLFVAFNGAAYAWSRFPKWFRASP